MYDYFLFERILIRTNITEDCWLWQGAVHYRTGYGSIKVHGHPMNTHRAMWIAMYGPLDDGMMVGQHCDVHRCVRPSHLFAGTRADAMRNARLKGRLNWPMQDRRRGQFVGSVNGQSKLTEDNVREIRAKYETGGWTMDELAKRFGVTRSNVYQVVHRKTWKHV